MAKGQADGPDGFEFLTRSRLWLVGKWHEGGTVFVRDGEFEGRIDLSPLRFGVLAVLILAAKRAKPNRKAHTWVSREFRTAAEIRAELRRHRVEVDLERITPLVYWLRGKFAAAYRPRDAGHAWAHRLIESRPGLGYRISTPPENLESEMSEAADLPDLPPAKSPNRDLTNRFVGNAS
jgi:hypothetical protein